MILHLSEYALTRIGMVVTKWRLACDSDNIGVVSNYIDESLFTALLSRMFYVLTSEDLENITNEHLDPAIVDIQNMIFDGADNQDRDLIADLYRAVETSEKFAKYVNKDSLTKYGVTADMISEDTIPQHDYESISSILICAFAKMIIANIPDIKDLTKLVVAIINANGGNKRLFKKLAKRNNDGCTQVMSWSKQGFIEVE